MVSTLKKAIVATCAALALGVGMMAGTGSAAAAGPGDLQIIGGVSCYFKGWGPTWDNAPGWRMKRFIGVRNVGGSTMTGVRVSEINGPTKVVKLKNQPYGVLKAGQTYIALSQTWNGCWPASISGFTIGDQVENIFNNYGYWSNSQQMPGSNILIPTPSPNP